MMVENLIYSCSILLNITPLLELINIFPIKLTASCILTWTFAKKNVDDHRSMNYLFVKCLLRAFYRSSPPEVFSGKVVPKICSKFTGEQPCQSVTSIKLLCFGDKKIVQHDKNSVHSA